MAILVVCAASVLWTAPPAVAVAIVQLPLTEPANLVFSWAGGAIISGGAHYSYEHVIVQPFSVTPGGPGDEVVAATVGPNGIPWIVSSARNGAGLSPQIDELTASGPSLRYSYPSSARLPTSIALGEDGDLWLTGAAEDLERYAPGGSMTSFPADSPTEVVAGPDGSLWFTDEVGGIVGRINTKGEVTTYPLSGGASVFAAQAGPFGIAVGPEGALWVAEQNLGRIARLTPSGELWEIPIPLPANLPSGPWWRAEPRYLAAGEEGDMWFTDPGTESIGRISPSGEITEYRIPPAPKSDYLPGDEGHPVPNHIAAVPGGLLFSETDAKALGFIEPAAAPIPETPPVTAARLGFSSRGARGCLRCVERCGPATRHARRSGTPKRSCRVPTALRR